MICRAFEHCGVGQIFLFCQLGKLFGEMAVFLPKSVQRHRDGFQLHVTIGAIGGGSALPESAYQKRGKKRHNRHDHQNLHERESAPGRGG